MMCRSRSRRSPSAASPWAAPRWTTTTSRSTSAGGRRGRPERRGPGTGPGRRQGRHSLWFPLRNSGSVTRRFGVQKWPRVRWPLVIFTCLFIFRKTFLLLKSPKVATDCHFWSHWSKAQFAFSQMIFNEWVQKVKLLNWGLLGPLVFFAFVAQICREFMISFLLLQPPLELTKKTSSSVKNHPNNFHTRVFNHQNPPNNPGQKD